MGAASSSASDVNGTALSEHQASQQQQPQFLVNPVSMETLDSSAMSTSNGGSGGPDAQTQGRTLVVSGLPVDVKPRELYLLFCAWPGYEGSQLKLTTSSKNELSESPTPVGFVTFATRQEADEARQKLHGVRFDPEQSQVICLELANTEGSQMGDELSAVYLDEMSDGTAKTLDTGLFISRIATCAAQYPKIPQGNMSISHSQLLRCVPDFYYIRPTIEPQNSSEHQASQQQQQQPQFLASPVSMETFATRQEADEARQKLHGVRFDPEQ